MLNLVSFIQFPNVLDKNDPREFLSICRDLAVGKTDITFPSVTAWSPSNSQTRVAEGYCKLYCKSGYFCAEFFAWSLFKLFTVIHAKTIFRAVKRAYTEQELCPYMSRYDFRNVDFQPTASVHSTFTVNPHYNTTICPGKQ